MSTKNIVENLIKNLIEGVNDITGKQDTNLTDSVNTLIEGYGGSGGSESNNEPFYIRGASLETPSFNFAIFSAYTEQEEL